ncbi:hypothetical protein [Halobellus rubicundus]|uniref:Uncharacterized protein n=1 Tax=Halobellus rubicundus TaxID=2996466 RepID=A0ABD5MCQ2_9EURY
MATVSKPKPNGTTETDFYLPGASISAVYDRLGDVVSRFVGRHGVVLIPESYNK